MREYSPLGDLLLWQTMLSFFVVIWKNILQCDCFKFLSDIFVFLITENTLLYWWIICSLKWKYFTPRHDVDVLHQNDGLVCICILTGFKIKPRASS